jgi:hypothetical protein
MFWTLAKILGQAYTAEVHQAWVKIFSSMMRVIVPIAVHHELKDNTAQQTRFERQFKAEFGSFCIRPSNEDSVGDGEAEAEAEAEAKDTEGGATECPVSVVSPSAASCPLTSTPSTPSARCPHTHALAHEHPKEDSSLNIGATSVPSRVPKEASNKICTIVKVDESDIEIRPAVRL